jgi:hypothetical protein
MSNSGKVNNYRRIGSVSRDSCIRANCCQGRKLYIIYMTANSFNRQLQLFVKLGEKEVYLFNVFLTTTINSWNFNGVYASIQHNMVPYLLYTLLIEGNRFLQVPQFSSGFYGSEYEHDCLLAFCPCSVVEIDCRTTDAYCLHHQGYSSMDRTDNRRQ